MMKRNKKSRPARPQFEPAPLASTQQPSEQVSADPIPRPKLRHDGWTPDKQKRFCAILADGGSIEEATVDVELSRRAAYALRRRDPDFAMHWDAARHIARQALVDEAARTALEGRTVVTLKDGIIIGESTRNSPALVLSALKRMRSKAILGSARIVAASHNLKTCLEMLEQGIAYPDPEQGDAPVVIHQTKIGWSPAIQRAFCEALSECGRVDQACEIIGKPRSMAYATRHQPGGEAFAIAWDASLLFASEDLVDLAMDLARKGSTEKIIQYGTIIADRRIRTANAQYVTAARLETLMAPVHWYNAQTIFKDCDSFGAKLDKLESGALQRAIEARDGLGAA